MLFQLIVFNVIQLGLVTADCFQSMSNEPRKQTFKNSNLSVFQANFSPDKFYSFIQATNSRINIIPSYAFANYCIEHLDLSNNQIADITSSSFAGMNGLKGLVLNYNQIEFLDGLLETLDIQEAGPGLKDLSLLDLSFNKIQKLTKPFSKMFVNLGTINLKSNSIEIIEPNIFSSLKFLGVLDLTNNLLKRLTNTMFKGLTNLMMLFLSENQIDEIDRDSFRDLGNLGALALVKNHLTYLNESTFEGLETLETLFLASNNLYGFHPRAFVGLDLMYSIDFSRNKYLTGPLVIENLDNLIEIYLRYIPIETVTSNHFIGFEFIEHLSLDQSKINNIQEGAFKILNNLVTLYLQDNKISSLGGQVFNGLSQLTTIQLNNNILSTIHVDAFQPLAKIENIDLGKNLLTSIPIGLFSNLASLKSLNLQLNQIRLLKTSSFRNMSSLKDLDLSKNEIVTIELGAFENLPNLETLDLSSNKIALIRKYFFSGLKSLLSLLLNGNGINSVESWSFIELINIKEITLGDNFIMQIDDYSFASQIQFSASYFDVVLNQNEIDEILPEMFAKSKIKSLSFQKNNLKSLASRSLTHLVNNTKLLDFSFNQLEFISHDLFGIRVSTSRVEQLILTRNLLIDLEFLVGDQFALIETLDVSFNRLETLKIAYFKTLNQLANLNISNNPIIIIESNFFEQLILQSLNLTNIFSFVEVNRLDLNEIDLSGCKNLKLAVKISNLTKLVLKNTDLKLSEISFGNFHKVEYLDLSKNLDDEKFNLDGLPALLKYLNLNEMKIKSLTRFNLNRFENLVELFLSNNEISSIEIDDFPEMVEFLDLSNNQISIIDAECLHANFHYLNLANNRIKSFFANDLMANRLVELNLSNNIFLVDFLSNQISNVRFSFLERIDISRNSIQNLSGIFQSLTDYNSLEVFSVNNNRISKIDFNCFYNMDSLIELDLSSNQISEIGWSSFLNTDNLESLNLGQNLLSDLDERTFANLVQLRYLNLSRNRIEHVNDLLFAQLYALRTLDLSLNQLKLVSGYSFYQMSFLEDIYLDSNPTDLIINEHAFDGLYSLINLYISFEIFSNEQDSKNILASLHSHPKKLVNNIPYYKTINIIHENFVSIDKNNCLLVLEFLKRNIQVNLRTDFEMIFYLTNCQIYQYD